MTTKSFPSIKSSFAQAGEITKDNLLRLLILNLVMFGVFIGAFGIGAIMAFVFFAGIIKSANEGITSPADFFTHLGPLSFYLIAFILLTYFLGLWFNAASTILLGENKKEVGVKESLKRSLKYVLPMFLAGLICFYLIAGGMALLIVPGILFSFFLCFVNLELVLGGKGILAAVKGSIGLVTQHFGDLFVRAIAYVLAYLGIMVFIPNIIMKAEPGTGIMLAFVLAITNWAIVWYSQAYFITLYKQARSITTDASKTKLLGYLLTATVGWLIIVGSTTLIVKLAKEKGEEIIKNMEETSQNEDAFEELRQDLEKEGIILPTMMPTTVKYQ